MPTKLKVHVRSLPHSSMIAVQQWGIPLKSEMGLYIRLTGGLLRVLNTDPSINLRKDYKT